jgi:hypothetical protein
MALYTSDFVLNRPSKKLSYPSLVKHRLHTLQKKISNGPGELDNVSFAAKCLTIVRRFTQQLEHDDMLTQDDKDLIMDEMLNVECGLYTHTFSYSQEHLAAMIQIVDKRLMHYQILSNRLTDDAQATPELLGDLHILPGAARWQVAQMLHKFM